MLIMKVTYELDTELDIRCHAVAVDACDALRDIEQQIRDWFKYDSRPAIPQEEIKDAFYTILQDNGIALDKIWG